MIVSSTLAVSVILRARSRSKAARPHSLFPSNFWDVNRLCGGDAPAMNTRQVKAYLGKTLAADCELFGASRQGDWIHVTFAIFPAGTGDAAEGHRPGVLTARIPYNQVNAELLSLPDHQPLRIEGPIAQVEPYAIRLKSVDFKVL